jgi:hypothetical protein
VTGPLTSTQKEKGYAEKNRKQPTAPTLAPGEEEAKATTSIVFTLFVKIFYVFTFFSSCIYLILYFFSLF